MPLIRIENRKQLLVDNYVIEDMWKVQRRLNQAVKHPKNPLIVKDHPWEGIGAHLYGTVIYDENEKLFKMWYQGLNTDPRDKHRDLCCYATSKDGFSWEKPMLHVIEYCGSRDNNIVMTGETAASGPAVMRDGRDPDPSRRYKMVYRDTLEGRRNGVCVAFSPDGIHWKPYDGNPVIMGHSDTQHGVVWDEKTGKYVMNLRPPLYAGTWKRRVAVSESIDFMNWSEPSTVLFPDELDPLEFYGMPIFLYEGVYFGLLQVFHHGELIDIQLTFSQDSCNWNRVLTQSPFNNFPPFI